MAVFANRREEAQAILARKLDAGLADGAAVYQRVVDQVPKDAIVRAGALRFGFDDGGGAGAALEMTAGPDGRWGLHTHALRQVADVAKMPGAWAEELRGGGAWQNDMLAEILNRSFLNGTRPDQRQLVRSVNGEARGFLSDRYRRLDSRPILEAFATAARAMGGVPYSGRGGDVRVTLKMVVPDIVELRRGEFVVFGLEWANSDFGGAANSLRAFLLRVMCLNGATIEDVRRQVHLGGKLDDSIEYSDRTYKLDTATTVSAIKDATRDILKPAKRLEYQGRIEAAQDREVSGSVFNGLAKQLSKDELSRARELFDGPDVQNLPEGQTAWRASNVLSWLANGAGVQPDRREDLEKMAGALLKAA